MTISVWSHDVRAVQYDGSQKSLDCINKMMGDPNATSYSRDENQPSVCVNGNSGEAHLTLGVWVIFDCCHEHGVFPEVYDDDEFRKKFRLVSLCAGSLAPRSDSCLE